MPTANDEAWSRFFSKTGVLAEIAEKGLAYVSADELKIHGQREPRLMAKLDTLSERPQPFKQHDLNILPVQNGLYVVYKDPQNGLYYKFDSEVDDTQPEKFISTIDLESFDSFRKGTSSESQVIDFAYLSSLFQHFCNCSTMHLTIRGRSYTGSFCFDLPAGRINVSNVQIEIDSGYESADSIILIEAKIGRRSDFNVRQLVYPFMEWSHRSKKQIRPIFLTYSNGEYLLTEFAVGGNFGDVRIISNKAFVINDNPKASIDLDSMLCNSYPHDEPEGIPFPQADDMNKIVDLVRLLESGTANKRMIADFFEFDERQSDYYANAAAYLGLAQRNKAAGGFELTRLGRDFLLLSSRSQRTRALIGRMLASPSLRGCVLLLKDNYFDFERVSLNAIQSVLVANARVSPGADTLARRARTVRMWLAWLLKNVLFC